MGVNVKTCSAQVAEYEACFNAYYDEFRRLLLAPCEESTIERRAQSSRLLEELDACEPLLPCRD